MNFFKIKEKKAKQTEIKKVEEELRVLKLSLEESQNKIDSQIKAIEEEIDEVLEKLYNPRLEQ